MVWFIGRAEGGEKKKTRERKENHKKSRMKLYVIGTFINFKKFILQHKRQQKEDMYKTKNYIINLYNIFWLRLDFFFFIISTHIAMHLFSFIN